MSGTPSHRARKKRKPETLGRSDTISDIATIDNSSNAFQPAFPLSAFLLPARGTTSQWIVLPVILIVIGLFRWVVGLWGYSGHQIAPMHGDFEAQRHWMEITNHLPMSSWYFYDLPYWGLDYPPLTAYHSWLCGKIGSMIDSSWFALDTSRGAEQPMLKLYMRATVLVSEYLVYIPAVIIFLRHYARNQGTGTTATSIALVATLMQPALILIDHGHFQYNTVMLGFLVAAMSNLFAGRLLWACIFYVASLGFKQMALYYSPVMFAYLLGSCLAPRIRPTRLLSIALITIATFTALFAPLLLGTIYDLDLSSKVLDRPLPPLLANSHLKIDQKTYLGGILLQLSQVIFRVFPFSRGLFEDKVANFWCLLHTFYKLHRLETIIPLPRLSLFATIMSILAPTMLICSIPRKSLLPYALASSAWGFFLFSFQVHEKSILLPLLPMTLLMGSKKGLSKEYRAWIGWANLMAVWTLYPLLRRDQLTIPYAVISLLWAYLIGLPPTSVSLYYNQNAPAGDDLSTTIKLLHVGYYIVMAVWHVLNAYIKPPDDKPDLWVVVNVCFGAVGCGICYLWCTWKLVLESGLLDEYLSHQEVVIQRKKAGKRKEQ